MHRFAVVALLAALALGVPTKAEMERKAAVNCQTQQICLYIWPKLPEVPGWHHDEEASFENDANFLLPDGMTLAKSDIAMFANAVAKDDYAKENDGHTDLAYFVAKDKEVTKKDNPDAILTEVEPLVTAEGRKLPTLLITGLKGGHRQMIAYEEDGEFFVCLTYDSSDEKLFNDNLPKFKAMVAAYKR